MTAAIDADFTKTFLFPPALEDFIPRDHPARFIREFVDYATVEVKLKWKDLEEVDEQTGKLKGDGRPTYAGVFLMRVWIYGYMHRVTTVRKLEAACREHVGLLWLTGLQAPDHNTLWRFWKWNRKAIRELFKQSLNLAVEAGMVGMVLHAVDGTKIQAKASTRTAWKKETLQKRLAKLEQRIQEIELEVSSHQAGDDEGYRLPAELQEKRALRETIAQRIERIEQERTNDLNPHEPEARMMRTGKGNRLAYNGQIVVDGQSGVITAESVVQDAYDQGQLMPMLDQEEENLGATAEETVADGGYNTEKTIVDAERLGRDITLAAGPADAESNPDKRYHASRFTYDAERDTYNCPLGTELPFEEKKNKGHGRNVFIYRCHAYATCPVATTCAKSPRGRTIERSVHFEIVERHRQKRLSDRGKAIIKQRSAIAERPFAFIKCHLGFVRFRCAGIFSAAAEWSWMSLTHNLRVLMKVWRSQMPAQSSA